jgi:hypothetical protein
MNQEELEELLSDCPTLYHMAERGSWPSIRERGLLSTTALLDLYEAQGDERVRIEATRRATSIELTRQGLPTAIIRDQLPMDDRGLRRCLPAHLAPADWYRLLNQRVFFWLTRDRLLRLLEAGTYRAEVHHVLELDSRALVGAYKDAIWLCPINSGCTKPMPHPRDENTFLRISEYPYSKWRTKRKRGERVVELSVDYSVPDVRRYVRRVTEMRGSEELGILYST